VPDIVEREVKAVRAQLARRASDKTHSFKRATDRDLANRLLDALEGVHTENVALQWIMKYFRKDLPPQYQIDQLLARAKGDPLVGGHIHQQFAPIRARILEDANLEQVLREVLRVIRQRRT
jgi:hypothetical protein